jgi:hypothetical protein
VYTDLPVRSIGVAVPYQLVGRGCYKTLFAFPI